MGPERFPKWWILVVEVVSLHLQFDNPASLVVLRLDWVELADRGNRFGELGDRRKTSSITMRPDGWPTVMYSREDPVSTPSYWKRQVRSTGRTNQISHSGARSKIIPRLAITKPLVSFSQRPAPSCNFRRLSVTTAMVTMRLSSRI